MNSCWHPSLAEAGWTWRKFSWLYYSFQFTVKNFSCYTYPYIPTDPSYIFWRYESIGKSFWRLFRKCEYSLWFHFQSVKTKENPGRVLPRAWVTDLVGQFSSNSSSFRTRFLEYNALVVYVSCVNSVSGIPMVIYIKLKNLYNVSISAQSIIELIGYVKRCESCRTREYQVTL